MATTEVTERSATADRDDATVRDDAGGRARTDPPEARARTDDAVTGTASGSVRAGSGGTETADGWLWKPVAAVGCLSLVAAVAVLVVPGTLVAPLDLAAETVRSLRSFAMLLGAFVGVFGLYVAYSRDLETGAGDSPSDAVELPAANPDAPDDVDHRAVGADLDERIARIGGLVDRTPDEAYDAYRVRRTLRDLSIRVVASTADCSLARAREHVDRGTWTDDVRAAAFVGGDDAPERPASMRLTDWASGRSFDRRVEATVDELAALVGVES